MKDEKLEMQIKEIISKYAEVDDDYGGFYLDNHWNPMTQTPLDAVVEDLKQFIHSYQHK